MRFRHFMLLLLLASVMAFIVAGCETSPYSEYSEKAPDDISLKARFEQLNGANTNFCAGPDILERTSTARLQGACCGAMDFHRYTEQVEGLKKYASFDMIPADPYDIPVSLAEELLELRETIKLTAEQQAVYDKAAKLSHEGGPCCCKCWRWYAFEGLAKYLIVEHDFSAEKIAEVWDLENGCGGAGHAHAGHGETHT